MKVAPEAIGYLESRVVSEEALRTLRALLDERLELTNVAAAADAMMERLVLAGNPIDSAEYLALGQALKDAGL